MTRDHTTIEELLAVQALGGLDGDDVRALAAERAAHGDCEECARLEAEFAETAGRLAFSLDPEPVDAAMADRILAETSAPADEMAERRTRRGSTWQAVIGVAAAMVLQVVAVSVFGPSRTTPIASASSTQRFVAFSGEGQGELEVAFTPGEPGAVLWGSDLPDPGEGMVYEVWMFEDETPIPGGCFTPVDGQMTMSVDADLSDTRGMALTAEPADCPPAPTGGVVKTADLTVT